MNKIHLFKAGRLLEMSIFQRKNLRASKCFAEVVGSALQPPYHCYGVIR